MYDTLSSIGAGVYVAFPASEHKSIGMTASCFFLVVWCLFFWVKVGFFCGC